MGTDRENTLRSGVFPSHKVSKLAMGGVLWTEFLGIFRHGLRRVRRRMSGAVANSGFGAYDGFPVPAPKPRLDFLSAELVCLSCGRARTRDKNLRLRSQKTDTLIPALSHCLVRGRNHGSNMGIKGGKIYDS